MYVHARARMHVYMYASCACMHVRVCMCMCVYACACASVCTGWVVELEVEHECLRRLLLLAVLDVREFRCVGGFVPGAHKYVHAYEAHVHSLVLRT